MSELPAMINRMASGNTSKLHHYVPQGYLRGFATDQNRISVRPLDQSRKPFISNTRNIAAQSHFHTLNDALEPDGFEKNLSELEGQAVGIIRRLIDGELPISEEDRYALSYFIALQSVRGPETRRTIDQLQAHIVRAEVGMGGRENVSRWVKKRLGFEPTVEQAERIWEEATQPGGPPIKLSNRRQIEHMVNTAQEITQYIFMRPWSIVHFKRRALLASDAPVTLVPHEDEEPWMGVGFQTAWGITFPLSRRCGLLMSDPIPMIRDFSEEHVDRLRQGIIEGKADRIQAGSTALERFFNHNTIYNAREYIYFHPDDEAFVPVDLPEPELTSLKADIFSDLEFDGTPMFKDAAASNPSRSRIK
ncbi:DUF4238 domain-containing protein [Leucobacter luti]|nr:DUF4238 domain-containing protein [Leucobacter luti]